MIIIKNTQAEDMVISLPGGEDELRKEVTIAPENSYEVPEELETEVLKWYFSAVLKVESTEEDTTETETETETTTETEDETAVSAAEAKLSEERAAFEAEKKAFAVKEAESKFTALLEKGKVTPAQKESYMALAESNGQVSVAEGATKNVSELLDEFVESAPKAALVREEEGTTEKEEEESKDVELSDEEKKVGEVFGRSADQTKELKKAKEEK